MMADYLEMLKYMRPEGSKAQREFCKRFLEPVFGPCDEVGNYLVEIGGNPNRVMFSSHHDTVHRKDGKQELVIKGDIVSSFNGSCLGADCTTGVWLMLEMIKAGVPGFYVVHAGEECGGIGSSYIAKQHPIWIDDIDACIAFDRLGTESIVTHQCATRTASDEFAVRLADLLGLPMRPDDTGVYTDSFEYAHLIPECTNISVGYYGQHTTKEYQDLQFLCELRDSLIKCDWSRLVIERDPYIESLFYPRSGHHLTESEDNDDLYEFVRNNPQRVADFLEAYSITVNDIEMDMW